MCVCVYVTWSNYQRRRDLGFSEFSLSSLTVVVRHGDNGEDEVDEVERAEEDDADKERHVPQSVRAKYLSVTAASMIVTLIIYCTQVLTLHV